MNRFFPGIIALIALFLSLSNITHAATASARASGDGRCDAYTLFDGASYTTTANLSSAMCDLTYQSGSRFGQSTSRVAAYFYTEPAVDVQTTSVSEDGFDGGVFTSATSTLTYQSDIVLTSPPPFFPGRWPLLLSSKYSMTDFGTSGVTASVWLYVEQSDGDIFFQDRKRLGVDPAEGSYILQGMAADTEPLTIILEATCTSSAPGDGSSSCQALIDPLIEFDQATFDDIYGDNSFVLEDYLAIELSPNLSPPPVPVPAAAWLFGSGLIGLIGAARRKRS